MPTGDRDITLFQGGSGGYGDALNVGRDSYAWAFNWDCRALGRAVPAIHPTGIGTQPSTAKIAAAFEWRNTSNNPIILYATGIADGTSRVAKIEDGAISTDNDQASGKQYTHGVLYRHNGSDADVEAAFFCQGAAGLAIIRRDKDGTYDTSGDAKADRLAVIGSDLWRVTGGYKLEKLTVDTSPITDSNWSGTQIPVGLPSFDINEVVDFGGSPFPLKGDGVFKYNAAPSSAVFENLTPFISPHPDNGKGGIVDGRGRIYYPTEDNGILVLTFGSQSQQRPTRFNTIDRDTPWGRITALAADAEYVYAATEPGSVRTQQLGLTVKKDLNGSFTDYTTETTDQKYGTEADFTDVDTPASDFIKVGVDEPFWGVVFLLSSARTNETVVVLDMDFSTSSGWTAGGQSHFDSTSVFFQDGSIVIDGNNFGDLFADGTWEKRTEDGDSKYWVRISPTTGTLAGAKVRQVYIIPYRPPLDPALFPGELGSAIAGALPKILVGQWRGETIVWQDVWTLLSQRIEQLLISRTSATATTGQRTLWAIHKDGAKYMPIGPDAHPARAAWPNITASARAIAFSGHNFDLPVNVKSVQKLVIHGEYLQKDDEFWVYWRWDNGDRWYKDGAHHAFPVVVNDLAGRGRVLHVAMQLKDATRDAVAPYITHAIIPEGMWEDEGSLREALGQDFSSPQTI